MRIALTHPTAWPRVRRGSERLLHDASHELARRGHAVTVITSAPGERVVIEQEGPVERVILPERRPPRALESRWLNAFHFFGLDLAKYLRERAFDAVHCLNYHDAAGALLARRGGARFRLVFQCTGIPVRRYFRRIPLDGLIFLAAARGADAVAVLSRFSADALKSDFGREGALLPSPTDATPFEAAGDPPRENRILFCGDANEPRKGALLLAQAFPAIAAALPGVRLVYCGSASGATRARVMEATPPDLRGRVSFLGVGRVEDLPVLYAGSLVCVNPALWEALGNVLIEALASGTPIVGARHAGIVDIVDSPRVGRLFDPGDTRRVATNVAGLAEAVVAAAGLAADPRTRDHCRTRARAFGWAALAPAYETLLTGAGEDGAAGRAGTPSLVGAA